MHPRSLLFAAALLAPASALLAQGALAPSAAPAATMRSLDQLEPRIPLGQVGGSTATLSISRPGSYVLMGDVTVAGASGIGIGASNVTLDLNGFTITSTAPTPESYGIFIGNGLQQITIGNGHIRGSGTITAGAYTGTGFSYGVCCFYNDTRQVRIHDLTVDSVASDGIRLGGTADEATVVVERCSVRTCGQRGIAAPIVRDCQADNCNWSAIVAAQQAVRCYGRKVHPSLGNNCIETRMAIDCVGISTAAGCGLRVFGNASGCHGISVSGPGLYCDGNALNCRGQSTSHTGLQSTESAENCTGLSDGYYGLNCGGSASNCTGTSNSGIGLNAEVALQCLGASSSSYGLRATTATNCRGRTTTGGYGLYAIAIATNCVGENPKAGGTALLANLAIGCVATSGSISCSSRYNMP